MFWGARAEARGLDQPTSIEEELNIVVLGDSQVGKTTLLEEYCSIRDSETTIDGTNGIDVHCKRLRHGHRSIPVVFHDFGGDTAQRLGQEFFVKNLMKRGSSNSDCFPIAAIIIVFDFNTKSSLYQMKGWLQWFYYNCQEAIRKVSKGKNSTSLEKSLNDLPVIVLGNKIDLVNCEPFFYFEFGQVPKEQREQLSGTVETIAKRLRSHLCMADCENLVFTSADCNPFKLSEVIDRVVVSVYSKTSQGIMNEEFSVCGVPLVKCIKGKAFKEEIMTSSWFSSLRNLFLKKDEPHLPL